MERAAQEGGPQCARHPSWPAVLAADADALSLLLEMKLRRRRERPSLPRTVTELVAEDGSRVYVVGTAHFSDDSKRDVVKVRPATLGWPRAERPLPASPRFLLRDASAPQKGGF